ncbi:DUF418 domain-containing protein [Pseudoxanthomonas taiwanensis]|jgi:Predicted membrane protein|uniref:DUF418 domain-containing protein n=1 Tax=Pseudoxanthomonas taiwanensis TaxID=176598 RepID=A0A921NV81_9GAMM|nr:DUF418 domain-containing protein [Pseudoxanthomonas taiwanensis]KAF1690415.1 hypothetical protein CR938_02275 [Pseudoxanthomonas taiwanensis]MBO2466714.1 hypothetical protein [Xanthomonadaceae bacterium]
MTANDLQPVAPAERLAMLDALRGLALCGILLMNMEGFFGPVLASGTGLDPALSGADRIADGLVYFFVQGKFFTLFSLLFGMGFAVMAGRAEAAGRGFVRVCVRRGLVLLGIGLLHAVLVWSGDILVTYALLSFLLLAFRPLPARWLACLGAAACLVSPLLLAATAMLAGVVSLTPGGAEGWNRAIAEGAADMLALVEEGRRLYASGGYGEVVALRLRELGSMVSSLPFFGTQVLGMFLLGAAFVRSGAIAAPAQHPRLFALLRGVALPLGLLAMAAGFALAPYLPLDRFDFALGMGQALMFLAGPLMCLGYVGWLVALFRTRAGARLAVWLAPAGRMALTLYLMQSLVCTLLSYGYGLGGFGQVGRAWQVLLALALFLVQVLLAHAWLARFRFGPVEWLWRSLTYGKAQPMRPAAPLPAA